MSISPDQAARSGLPPAAEPAAKERRFVERWSYLIFFLGLVCTTSAPIFVRLSEIGPVATGAWRLTLALPFLALMLRFETGPGAGIRGLDRKDLWLLLLAGVFFASDLALWNSSVTLTSVASASFLANGAPVFVVLGSWLLFREQPSRMFLVGLVVGIAGSAVMMSESLAMSSRNFIGDTLSLVAAAFYAAYLLAVARSRKRASTMTLMVFSSAGSAVILWMLAPAVEAALIPTTTEGWLVVIGTALLTQVAGQTLIALSLGYISSNFSALILLLQPVIPTLAAWILFDETLSGMQVVGAVGIVIGLALARPR
ncbi:MAG: DMT family transporter [Proteobacteria bacterium]|nr:DMT family transporter [Pseudomonadota bacterium]